MIFLSLPVVLYIAITLGQVTYRKGNFLVANVSPDDAVTKFSGVDGNRRILLH